MSMSTKIQTASTRIRSAGVTHRGRVRETNQDVLIVEPQLSLYGVLDGMGGAASGDVAARLAADTIVSFAKKHAPARTWPPSELLNLAINAAAATVYLESTKSDALEGMGTTVVACVVELDRLVVAHVGDSRAYLWRRGELRALTRDHTVARELMDAGSLSFAEAAVSRTKHFLTRNLGSDAVVLIDLVEHALEPGDRVLLCSDGLHDVTSDEEMAGVLASAPERAADQLVELALPNATDNISAVVIAVERL
jgi:protein phosphatase